MKRTLFSLGIIFGVLLMVSVQSVEAFKDPKSLDTDIVHTKANFQKQSIDANKEYNKAIISIQSDYDRAKSYAKQVYESNIQKANGNLQKQSNAKYVYNEMLSIAKTDYKKSFSDAKKSYDEKLIKITKTYSTANTLKIR